MPNTTNFNFPTPADTDLVKDGASAIRSLGNSIDTAFVDLKGGTTGQVLSKASNTDLDFTWVAQDDSNAIQNAIVDAKGDLISATAADTPARLAVGANGTVLTADSAEATGLKWAAPASGGKVLQVVSTMKTDTFTSTTANTWVDVTGLSVSITPSATSSKVLIFATTMIGSNAGAGFVYLKVLRGSTDLAIGDAAGSRLRAAFGGRSIDSNTCSGYDFTYLDSPSSTSALTYKIQIYAQAGAAAAYVNRSHTDTDSGEWARLVSSITAIEIGA